MSLDTERFTYAQLKDPTVESIDEFAFRILPLELRTPEYDERLLNGGVNKANSYSSAEHLATDRWQEGQEVRNRIEQGRITARIAIGEAALRNFGSGNPEVDRQIQRRALKHIAVYALAGHARIAPYSVDTRGAATDNFMVVRFTNKDPLTVDWSLTGGRGYNDPQLADRTTNNFNEIWEDSLSGQAAADYLRDVASELH
jgi:hypothetical protein